MFSGSSEPRTDAIPVAQPAHRGGIALWIRRLALPIIIGWVVVIGFLNVSVPQLEVVGEMRSVSMSPGNAPAVIATKRVGTVFDEFSSDSSAMIVLEDENQLDEADRDFYKDMIAKLEADPEHVQHVQDFWGDPLTAAGAQSSDGKSTYVQVYTAGNQGEALANESIEKVQDIVYGMQPPPGLKVYVTGPAALAADQQIAADRSLRMIEGLTFLVIIVMLLLIYRSVVTMLITIVMVVLCLLSARGVVAFLGYHEIIGLSVFATSLLVTLAIAASTDYAIFLLGRYQEARAEGEDRESAYFTMFHGTAHVVMGSGLTIAGATFCLHFTNMPYFVTLGIPLAIGMVVVVFAALTLGPAIISIASRFGKTLEPRRAMRTRGWRKIGAAIVRWPGPILVTTMAISMVGLLALPGYQTSYNDRNYLPTDLPAQEGYAAADRHFSQARMNPELLLVESDH
ncbi:MMPL family transporter, partial [Mycolicibacterium bacteremicum]